MDNKHTSAAGKCLLFLLSVSASVFPFLRFDQVLTAPSNSVVPDALTSIGSALTGTAAVSAILCCAFYMLGLRRYDKDLRFDHPNVTTVKSYAICFCRKFCRARLVVL